MKAVTADIVQREQVTQKPTRMFNTRNYLCCYQTHQHSSG